MQLTHTSLMAALMGFIALGAFTAVAADPKSEAHVRPAATGVSFPAHVACERALSTLSGLNEEAKRAIVRDDLKALHELHEDVRRQLVRLRVDIDKALLVGAWKSREFKGTGFEVINRLEGIKILNHINRALLTGYSYPANKVPESVQDATTRMFRQLQILHRDVSALNGKVASAGNSSS